VDCVPDKIADAVIFTGVPQFDDFRPVDGAAQANEVLLIDHQFHQQGLFGWNETFRRDWTRRVADAVFRAGFERLHVKVHPGDRSDGWRSQIGDHRIRIVDRPELVSLSRTVPVVLGTFSTMQMPFAALPNVALLSLEIHPESGWFPSRRFVEAGVAEPVRSYSELSDCLRQTSELQARQRPAKAAFLKRFLGYLDGRAGQRMTQALVGGWD
jgi:hypothetical protein